MPKRVICIFLTLLFSLSITTEGKRLRYTEFGLFSLFNNPSVTFCQLSPTYIKKDINYSFTHNIYKEIRDFYNSAYLLYAQSNVINSKNEEKESPQKKENDKNADLEKRNKSESKKNSPQYEQYVQIKVGVTRILDTISPTSPVLGLATKGSHFPLVKAGARWCAILYEDKRAWVALCDVNIVDSPSSSKMIMKEFSTILLIIISIVFLLAIFYFFAGRRNKIKTEWFATAKKKMKIVIIAKKETQVQRLLTNKITSLDKCFTEIGFEVKKASDSDTAKKLIYHYIPDAVVVDWQIGRNTPVVMEHILSSKSLTNNIFVLYYNLPDPDNTPKSKAIPNSHYLGISFTDRELFKVITPLIITGEKKHTIRKSIESSALQGDIADCNLSEVFQFVEIGNKTGCLLIEDKEPSGIIYFNNGIIIYAASKHRTGEKAVFDILNLGSGQFYFVHGRKPKSSNCSVDTRSILFEWAKITDETSWDRLRQT